MNTDTKGPRITARSFFREMRTYGYSPNQIIRIINELLDLVTHCVQEGQRPNTLVDAAMNERILTRNAR
ncbi:hypothetical protein CYFUS_007483 [Cystobacter fuscus]|uniref:Uncharacterized protein n=1 Tax=Cystobacter fuscus TaxID=43 RepID=A0A250JET8_9BACT|nr:hypothetical protein [Cystobacter fuscus]ATB42007.1 hypothetical protein CYFUS_007483 [Cystobacter fuscus]AYM53508.1 hypothetical protein [Cystobacter fuscus]